MANLPGGFSETQDATEDIQKICDQVKPDVEKMTGKKYMEFRAFKFWSEVETGQIFHILVYVGGPSYSSSDLLLKILQNSETGKIELLDVRENHRKDDPIETS